MSNQEKNRDLEEVLALVEYYKSKSDSADSTRTAELQKLIREFDPDSLCTGWSFSSSIRQFNVENGVKFPLDAHIFNEKVHINIPVDIEVSLNNFIDIDAGTVLSVKDARYFANWILFSTPEGE